jgi:hypothetical protein
MGKIEMLEDDQRGLNPEEYSDEVLDKALWWVKTYGYGFTILMAVLWPILSLPAGVFTKSYWAMWVFISLAWGFVASGVIIALPLYESKDALLGVVFALAGKQYAPETSAALTDGKKMSVDSGETKEAAGKAPAGAEGERTPTDWQAAQKNALAVAEAKPMPTEVAKTVDI